MKVTWLWIINAILSLSISLVTYSQLDWHPSPDGVQLACAVDHIVNAGELFDGSITHNIQLNYTPCWQSGAYPILQRGVVGLRWFTASGEQAVLIYAIVMSLSCVWLIQYCVAKLLQSQWWGFVGGVLTSLSLGLLRSVLMTPHNLTGFVSICLVIVCLLPTNHLRWWKKHLLAWLCIMPLFWLHQLSFMLAAITLGLATLTVLLKQRQWLMSFLIVVGAYCLAAYVTKSWLPNNILSYLTSLSATGITKPWWDHLAIWGYLLVPMAAFGCVALHLRSIKNKPPLFLVLLIPVLILWSDLGPLLGWRIVPDRVTAYAWMPLVILTCYGLYWFSKTIPKPLFIVMTTAIVLGQATQAISFVNSDLIEIQTRYLPSENFISAMEWLNAHVQKKQLTIGLADITNRQIQYAGLWYHHDIAVYPWSDMNYKDITDFTPHTAALQNVVQQPSSQAYADLYGLYNIMTHPATIETRHFIDNQHVKFVILARNNQADTIWQTTTPTKSIAYQNDEYTIYAVK